MKTQMLKSPNRHDAISTWLAIFALSCALQAEEPSSPAGLLVKWKDGPAGPAAVEENARIGATVKRNFNALGWQLVELPSGLSLSDGLRTYSALEAVASVEPDRTAPVSFPPAPGPSTESVSQPMPLAHASLLGPAPAGRTPNDPMFNQQWYLKQIGAPFAWDTSTGSSNVVVAIIDTGVDYRHPDLAPNMWHNPGETGLDANGHDKASNGIDDDGNGYVDDVYGVDVTTGSGDPIDTGFYWPPGTPATAPFYHGTVVAGIVGAAGNNGIGIAGVNWSVSIMAIKGFTGNATEPGPSYLQFSSALAAWDYILQMKRRGVNIRVTNDSIGSTSSFAALREVVAMAAAEGVLPVVAAGNDGLNKDNYSRYDSQVYLAPVLAVGGSTENDTLWSSSDFSPSTVHLAAPAVNIRSTTRGGGYAGGLQGTSFAAPQVAATAALLLGIRPGLSVDELKGAILGSVDHGPSFGGKVVTGGRLNVAQAVYSLDDPNPPAVIVTALPAGPRTTPEVPIEVHFSRAMNPTSVEGSFLIHPDVTGRFEWAVDRRSFRFIHDAVFDRNAVYTVRILGSAQDKAGGTIDGNFDRNRTGSPEDDFVFTFHFPVGNDAFAEATELAGPAGSISGTTRSTMWEWERAEPVPKAYFDPQTLLSLGSVWYRWTPPTPSGWYTFDLTSGTSFDSYLAVYRGESLSALLSVAENDNYGGRASSRVSFPADPAVRYSIAVLARDGTSASGSGPFRLSWHPTPSPGFTGSQLSPSAAMPGTKVTLTGTNFTGATAVLFNGATATFANAPTNNADLRITAIVPPDAKSGPITVVTPHGTVASTLNFELRPPPISIVRRADGQLELRWSAIGGGVVLESTDDLTPAHWRATAVVPVTADGGSRVTLTSAAAQFYRLRAP